MTHDAKAPRLDAETWEDGVAAMVEALLEVDATTESASDFTFGRRAVGSRGWYWSFTVSRCIGTAMDATPRHDPSLERRMREWIKEAIGVATEAATLEAKDA